LYSKGNNQQNEKAAYRLGKYLQTTSIHLVRGADCIMELEEKTHALD
jgi:hypothetical protein